MMRTIAIGLYSHLEPELDTQLIRVHALVLEYNKPLYVLVYLIFGAPLGGLTIYIQHGTPAVMGFAKLFVIFAVAPTGYWVYMRLEVLNALRQLYRAAGGAHPPYIFIEVSPGRWVLRATQDKPEDSKRGLLIVPLNFGNKVPISTIACFT